MLATIGTAGDPAVGGMVIGEWNPGSIMGDATADTLRGKRLVFLTGSREASTLTSEGAGIYDLSADGAKMFLNAVNYMAGVQPGQGPAPAISITRSGANLSIAFTGTLQSSSSVTGGWADEVGASSPFTVTPTQPMKFYRAKK